mmetsp:Transcript_21380/g.36174  ORF Transcript_21380/g.36174 Transcript_21380/m.36174 type:complete len:220 (+) Transcript_21380:105-764(+)
MIVLWNYIIQSETTKLQFQSLVYLQFMRLPLAKNGTPHACRLDNLFHPGWQRVYIKTKCFHIMLVKFPWRQQASIECIGQAVLVEFRADEDNFLLPISYYWSRYTLSNRFFFCLITACTTCTTCTGTTCDLPLVLRCVHIPVHVWRDFDESARLRPLSHQFIPSSNPCKTLGTQNPAKLFLHVTELGCIGIVRRSNTTTTTTNTASTDRSSSCLLFVCV